ncbi:MAG: DUF4445 domain-containing protein [Chloroflexi bacterium]|nr:DUF4445 domain-containing protein [Chloroflexota bacterium]
MAGHTIRFSPQGRVTEAPTGTLLSEAVARAGIDLVQPCGGQGRCGRCVAQVCSGEIRARSTLRLSEADLEAGYVLACQAVVEGDAEISIPPQEELTRHLTSDRTAGAVSLPQGYDPQSSQTIRRIHLDIAPPSTDDQTDDWSRLLGALRRQASIGNISADLNLLRRLGVILRASGWRVVIVLDQPVQNGNARLLDIGPPETDEMPLYGITVDIGTTTVTVWLVDLLTGDVKAQASEYNQQIRRGEDIIARIIYASKNDGGHELRQLVLQTINGLVDTVCQRARTRPEHVVKAAVSGNTTMLHLLLGIPPASIRLTPFVPVVNQPPPLTAAEIGLEIHPRATVDCLPGVASYVGADITAGTLSSGLEHAETTSLFIDVGTNGEIVLGSREWLIACACSAGPAFEGAGVRDGMRATKGAIEEVWISSETLEPTCRVIGGGKPRGLCGSGLISLIAELFLNGLLDKAGNVNVGIEHPRLQMGEHGAEYVLVWAEDTVHGENIVLNHVDVDNLLRAKAAIYAGFSVLAESVGMPLEEAQQVLVGGSFGQYINVEKAIEIGLFPDVAWEKFKFLGNTSVQGAYLALIDRKARQKIADIAARMTYLELSADNTFYEAFTSALFLPHTDMSRFPSVAQKLARPQEKERAP